MNEARMQSAVLYGADLAFVKLRTADLSDARFGAHEEGGPGLFEAANLENSTLDGAIMRGAKLIGVRLNRASMISCDLTRADLTRADLSDVDLGLEPHC